jgi:hypothetical protein
VRGGSRASACSVHLPTGAISTAHNAPASTMLATTLRSKMLGVSVVIGSIHRGRAGNLQQPQLRQKPQQTPRGQKPTLDHWKKVAVPRLQRKLPGGETGRQVMPVTRPAYDLRPVARCSHPGEPSIGLQVDRSSCRWPLAPSNYTAPPAGRASPRPLNGRGVSSFSCCGYQRRGCARGRSP